MEDYYEEMVPRVYAEGEWIPTSKVEFEDIEEDFQGVDVMTFIYEGKTFSSQVRLK